MDTASPRDIARLLQILGRKEKAALGEHTSLARGELCRRAFHEMGRDWASPALRVAATARAR